MHIRTAGLILMACLYGVQVCASEPQDVARALASLKPGYALAGKASPRFLRGDFDGDGIPDLALEVTHSGDQGLAIFLSSRQRPVLIAAGKPFFAWSETSMDFDEWSIYPKQTDVEQGVEGAGSPPKLKGDALYLKWDEAGSGLVYWAGARFEWYQQGD